MHCAAFSAVGAAAVVACAAPHPSAPDAGASGGPRELGAVTWRRRLEPALAEARTSARPVLLLFQEVPGWSTCVTFGEGPLRLPLLVEAAETLFVPVAARNNVDGYEGDLRERFDEPAWNNPVVRFLDADAADVVPRQEGVWSSGALLRRMSDALAAAGRDVPTWLRTVTADAAGGDLELALFAMTWYWEGEAQLGSLDGVVATRAVWVGAREVVEVAFRPAELSYSALLDVAIARSCDQRVFATSDAQLTTARAKVGERAERYDAARHGAARAAEASDQLHYLGRSPLRFLPLTPGQARQVNAALGARVLGAEVAGTDAAPESFLSPRQRALAARVGAVLVRDPRALEGLDRPADVGALDEYEAALRERLGPEPVQGQRRGPGGA